MHKKYLKKTMSDFKEILKEIKVQFDTVKYDGDLSDIGNEIGIVLGKYISKDKVDDELNEFLHGIKHGISLTNGTHG